MGQSGPAGAPAGDYTLVLRNCFNIGTVSALTHAGGIVGHSAEQSLDMEYCYNLSTVSSPSNSGGLVARLTSYYETVNYTLFFCYNINSSYFGTPEVDSATVTNTGLINADGTFPNGTPYPDLLTALNAWVNANKQTYLDTYNVELKNWVMGDNGYPTFAE